MGVSLASLQHGYTATCESGAAPLDGLLSWRLALAPSAAGASRGLQGSLCLNVIGLRVGPELRRRYLLTVAFLLVDVLQLLSFGFDVDTPPSITSLAKDLAALQTFGLDAFSPTAVLGAAVAAVPRKGFSARHPC